MFSFLILLWIGVFLPTIDSTTTTASNGSTSGGKKGVLTFTAYKSPIVQERAQMIDTHCDNDNGTVSEGCRRVLLEQRQPLFRGQGTHYVFLWVGTPPQRVSVIVDTGSHHTAFPCVGCNCGKHMDPHFDPKKSSSSNIKKCGLAGQKCFFKQAYSEGSSWHAFKVTDLVASGGEKEIGAVNQSVKFEFGCQDSETGLFRTQHVDGIMGLSAAEETLPYQLQKQQVTDTKSFSLCFRVNGGIVSFGGYNDAILHHALPVSTTTTTTPSTTSVSPTSVSGNKLSYVKLIKSHGWFTVKLLDISLAIPSPSTITTSSTTSTSSPPLAHSHHHTSTVAVWKEKKSIGGPLFKCNNGKGTIIDSGTTDTYLPSALHSHFTTLFAQFATSLSPTTPAKPVQYKNEVMHFTSDDVMRQSLPTIIYRFAGMQDGEEVEIEVGPESYMEKIGQGKYIPRVYLTESIGAVLGANFMNNHLIVFDIEQMRVGFAKSKCHL